MKKEFFLVVGIAALFLAAKEYGVDSPEKLKKLFSPYLKLLDLNKLQEA